MLQDLSSITRSRNKMTVPIRKLSSEQKRAYFAERARIWRQDNPERLRHIQRRWYELHREAKLAAEKLRRQARAAAALLHNTQDELRVGDYSVSSRTVQFE